MWGQPPPAVHRAKLGSSYRYDYEKISVEFHTLCPRPRPGNQESVRMSYHIHVPSFYVQNFGCRATQADGAAIEHQFEQRGLVPATTAADSDLVVLNTCTVTAAADQDARAAIRRIQRRNPAAKIIVTGCYAQRAPEEIAMLPGVTCVIGNSHKHQLADLALQTSTDGRCTLSNDKFCAPESDESRVANSDRFWVAQRFSAAKDASTLEGASAPQRHSGQTFIPVSTLISAGPTTNDQRPIFVSDIFAHSELLAAPVFEGTAAAGSHENARTRPNLKVQDGCDNRCSFCVIPSVRGQSRSLQLHQILREVTALVKAGYREVVVSGINLGRWGRDLALGMHGHRPTTNNQPPHFEDLIRAILEETRLEKLRVSSVEPMDWTDDLIALVAHSPRIAKHAHVPLQSGSDAVLRRMHRKYRPWHYREKIEKIHASTPTAAIGADVMVGFPGETAAEFDETRRLIEDLPFTYLHVFTYSARPGTAAAAMPYQVPTNIARDRNRILRDLAAEKKLAFMRSFIGKTVEAITLGSYHSARKCGESERRIPPPAFTEALTENYLQLQVKGMHQQNRWLRVRVEDLIDGVLVGTRSAH